MSQVSDMFDAASVSELVAIGYTRARMCYHGQRSPWIQDKLHSAITEGTHSEKWTMLVRHGTRSKESRIAGF